MSDCHLFAGDPRGKKCAICGEPLRVGDIIYEWEGKPCEVGCMVQYAAARLSPPTTYPVPGADWQAP